MPDAVADTAFRIAVEALTNARKHAQATRITIRIGVDGKTLGVEVTDDGKGFEGAVPLGHFGIGNMRDRAEALGGSCTVSSGRRGTTVSVRLPLTGTPPQDPPELSRTIRELDIERSLVTTERDGLRRALDESRQGTQLIERRLHCAVGLGDLLRQEPGDAQALAMITCRHVATSLFDAAAVRIAGADVGELRRIASWHEDPVQLAFLNQFLFIDRTPGTSNAHFVFKTGEPVVIDRTRSRWWPGDGTQPPEAPIAVHCAVMVPLIVARRIVGVITACRDRTEGAIEPDDVAALRSVADTLGASLPNIRALLDAE